MTDSPEQQAVYLEIGKKRTIAGALDWPGWCRVGRDAQGVLEALLQYGPRYERVARAAGLSFDAPASASTFRVVERLEGNTTTDFGAPDVPPSIDSLPVDDAQLRRLQTLLEACWTEFQEVTTAAEGKELRKGPRGGGRDLAEIARHVIEAEWSYLGRLGGKRPKNTNLDAAANQAQIAHVIAQQRQAVLDALSAATRGEFPSQGPRGGARWTPRFFVRRAAWHVLDHAWEIEDRIAE